MSVCPGCWIDWGDTPHACPGRALEPWEHHLTQLMIRLGNEADALERTASEKPLREREQTLGRVAAIRETIERLNDEMFGYEARQKWPAAHEQWQSVVRMPPTEQA